MRLSLNTILMHMKDFGPEYREEDHENTEIDNMRFYQDEGPLEENCIYICTPDELEKAEEKDGNFIFFSVKNSTAEIYAHRKNVILFSKTDSPRAIFENYLQTVNEISGWERSMHQALLYSCTAEELLSIAAEQIPLPTVFFDTGFNVVDSRSNLISSRGAETVTRLGYTPPEYMAIIKERSLLTRVEKSSRAVVAPAVSADNSYNIYRCHRVNGKIAGYSTIFCGEEKPLAGYVDVCEIYFQVLDLFLKITTRNDQTQTYMYESLLSSLIQSPNPSERQLSERLKYVGLPEKGSFSLVKFVFKGSRNYNAYLCGLLQKYYPERYFFLYQDGVYFLYAQKKGSPENGQNKISLHKETMDQVLSETEERLGRSNPAACYVSNPFYALTDLYYAGLQVDAMEKAMAGTPLKNNRIFFEDCLLESLISALKNSYSPSLLILPIYKTIKEYDSSRGTKYLKTIQAYLENNCSLEKTAAALGLHRNSADKRIKKAGELFHIDLEEPETRLKFMYSFKLEEILGNEKPEQMQSL